MFASWNSKWHGCRLLRPVLKEARAAGQSAGMIYR